MKKQNVIFKKECCQKAYVLGLNKGLEIMKNQLQSEIQYKDNRITDLMIERDTLKGTIKEPLGKAERLSYRTHKSHSRLRGTVCGIKYDSIQNLALFIKNNLRGHWNKVNCNDCLKGRFSYEKSLRLKKKEQV